MMTLHAALRERTHVLVEPLQGRRSDLLVHVTLHEGKLAAVAQWTPVPRGAVERHYFYAVEPESVARLLTFASAAVAAGRA